MGAEHVPCAEEEEGSNTNSWLGRQKGKALWTGQQYSLGVQLFKIKLFCFLSKYKLSETADIFNL